MAYRETLINLEELELQEKRRSEAQSASENYIERQTRDLQETKQLIWDNEEKQQGLKSAFMADRRQLQE